jgi:5-methylcytosine-specific restriction protein A
VRREQRSAQADAYRWLYGTPEWAALKETQLSKQPLCERCSTDDRPVAATVVNHRTPHRGDRRLFRDPLNLESTCKPCHDGPIQREERLGFSPAVDVGGWPTDPRHPSNRPPMKLVG